MGQVKQPRITVYYPWKFEQGKTPGTGRMVRGKRAQIVAIENFPRSPLSFGVDADGNEMYGNNEVQANEDSGTK